MADFVHQRQRWASGTLQSLRLRSGPLHPKGLSLGQRIAYLEGVMHWFNNVPRLVLMLMPLSYGLLGIIPILLNSQAALTLLLPLWGLQVLTLGWLNRGSRTAFLSELTGWVLTVPLTVTVLSNLIGRIGGFRVTPKHQRRDRGSTSVELLLPLLALVLLNLVNLHGLLSNASDLPDQVLAGRPVGVVWGLINLLSLIVAVRACWDPAAKDLAPWQKLQMEAWIEDDGGHRYPCCITALSESGARITCSPSTLPWVGSSKLRWCQELPALPVILTNKTETEALLHWGDLARQDRYALIRWLFCRPGCWVDRQAPQEGRALLALLRRLIAPPKRGPFRPSLIPQHPPVRQASTHP
jgi:cellulose synthase (UDP-forming)